MVGEGQGEFTINRFAGARIWLSGSIPKESSGDEINGISTFVREFARSVFRAGGHILHGAHPSFTGILLDEARRHIEAGGRRDCLTLAVSRRYSKNTDAVPLQEWRKTCVVFETPEAKPSDGASEESLRILRQWMADQCDAFVGVGGAWFEELSARTGVPLEMNLAKMRGLPCFLLGGLGGAARRYLEAEPDVIKTLKNGLDDDLNLSIALHYNPSGLADLVFGQLCRLPLVRGRVADGVSFRILALDGGGIKGAFTAGVLATVENILGESVAKQFDMIAGTSTGGITAIALGMGLSPAQMLQFYRDRGTRVFPTMRLDKRIIDKVRQIFKPKYSQDVLKRELKNAYFGNGPSKTLSESQCRLVIPAYDAISGVCHVFRTPHHPLLKSDAGVDASDVALATAAAPTFFSPAVVKNLIASTSFVDGGVWANCPAMAAIIEAVCYLKVPLDRIDILSIGTTDEPFTLKHMADAGLAKWGKSIISLLMNAQVDAAVKHAQQLVGEPRFLRLNVMTPVGAYKLDSSQEIENLIALGNAIGRNPETLFQIRSRFLNGIEAADWK